MANEAKASSGTIIKMFKSAGPPATYTQLGEITDVDGAGGASATVIDKTNMGSGGVAEKIGGIVDYGPITLNINYDPMSADTVDMRKAVGKTKDFVITYEDSLEEDTFKAVFTSFKPKATVNGVHSATITLDVTGKPSWG